MRRHGPSSAFRLLVLMCGLGLVFAVGVLALRVGPVPKLAVEAHPSVIGPATRFVARAEAGGRGLENLRLELSQGPVVLTLAERHHTPAGPLALFSNGTTSDRLESGLRPEEMAQLRNGEATLRLVATRAGTFLRHPDPVQVEQVVPVRTTPPTLSVVSSQHYLTQGGAEVVVYRVGDRVATDGVRVGGLFFPGHPLPGGAGTDRFALFACPWDMDTADGIRLVAADDAGNEATVAFVDRFSRREHPSEAIAVSEGILNRVAAVLRETGEDRGSPLERFLLVNREVRQRNAEALRSLASRSVARFLWKSAFMRMPGTKAMSGFALPRTYTFEGREVDRQTHLGVDLAATSGAAVPAANDGIVLFAGYLGIYGNAVVLDHGFGLMTLYAHLSSIAAVEGQEVARGLVIGRTGMTGLAAGDHLHFSMLIQGVPVDPSEWWDGHWVRDRIGRKLGTALPFEYTEAANPRAAIKAKRGTTKPTASTKASRRQKASRKRR